MKLVGLRPQDFAHPQDRAALESLRRIPGLTEFVRKVNSVGLDRMLLLENLGNGIRVNPHQFGELFDLFQDVRETLGVGKVDFFIRQQYSLNAWACGVDSPQVVLTTEMVDRMTEAQLKFVIGHELGHVMADHVLLGQIGRQLPLIMSIIGQYTLNIGRLVGDGLAAAVYDWMRKSELTADRVGLLATQDRDASISTLCTLAGIPAKWARGLDVTQLSRQVDEFEKLSADGLNSFYRYIGQAWSSHPWVIVRITELRKWIDSGEYDKALSIASMVSPENSANRLTCPKCGQRTPTSSIFCHYCGALIGSYSE